MPQDNQAETPVTTQVENGFPKEIQAGSKLVSVKTELEVKIWDALKECYDPEIPVNIVDLGLVYHIAIDESVPEEVNVFVRMTLTAPGCGMAPMIAADVRRKVMLVHTVKNAHIDLVFDPPWTPALMSEAAKLMLNM